MIGDNLETDILVGINAKIDTLLVLTGVTNESELLESVKGNKITPTYYSNLLNE
jgi:4-nitrophenyl phosphatase